MKTNGKYRKAFGERLDFRRPLKNEVWQVAKKKQLEFQKEEANQLKNTEAGKMQAVVGEHQNTVFSPVESRMYQ